MTTPAKTSSVPLKVGQPIRLKGHNLAVGRIVEYRGHLMGDTRQFYGVAFSGRMKISEFVLPDDEFEVIRRFKRQSKYLKGRKRCHLPILARRSALGADKEDGTTS